MSDNGEIIMYLPGCDDHDARTYFPYDTYDQAREFCDATGTENVYKVTAYLDFSTMKKVTE